MFKLVLTTEGVWKTTAIEVEARVESPSLAVVNGEPAVCYLRASTGNLMFARALDSAGSTESTGAIPCWRRLMSCRQSAVTSDGELKYVYQGSMVAAQLEADVVLALNPNSVPAHAVLGYLAFHSGEMGEARAAIEIFVALTSPGEYRNVNVRAYLMEMGADDLIAELDAKSDGNAAILWKQLKMIVAD